MKTKTKIIILTLLIQLSGVVVFAQQDTTYIYSSGSLIYKKSVAEIDSMKFSGDAQKTINFFSSGNIVFERLVTDIDSIIFYDASITVTDIDNNTYTTVQIGDQIWMAENLRTTRYNDGTIIPNVTDNSSWEGLSTGAYSWYNNNSTNTRPYGGIYNGYAVETGKLCPSGWHVPSDSEWTELEIYLQNNDYNYDGTIDDDQNRNTNNRISKSLALETLWNSSTTEGAVGNTDYPEYRNKSAFNAVPGGCRNYDGSYSSMGNFGFWWSGTESSGTNLHGRSIRYSTADTYRGGYHKINGLSVRCVMD
ncbi:fibrobacter succinogenes major paralogous domain-containing protein [Bacteroidales bacterium OttesenSCG-928-I21]|nr:fibrobacter succinogenes major paralogous domain-containing protein [Bacteroidales bacterium OttesenSCG-928-I21]